MITCHAMNVRFITYGPGAISTGLSQDIQWNRNNALKSNVNMT